jgi:hypothetical protein
MARRELVATVADPDGMLCDIDRRDVNEIARYQKRVPEKRQMWRLRARFSGSLKCCFIHQWWSWRRFDGIFGGLFLDTCNVPTGLTRERLKC